LVPVIIGSLLPIITLPIFTRELNTEEYGVFALSQVYAVFLNGVANFGLLAGFERNYFEFKNTFMRTSLLYSIVVFVLLVSLLFTLVTFTLERFILTNLFHIEGYHNLLTLAYLATAVSGFKLYFLSYFKNSEDAKSYAFYSIDETILTVFFSLVLLIAFDLKVYGLILGQLISATFVFILLIVRFSAKHLFSLDLLALKACLKFSLPMTPKIFFGVLGSQLDKYLIGLLSSLGGVAIYNIAQKIANVTFTFMTAVQNVFSPQVYARMFELEKGAASKSIGVYLTPFYYISIFVGLGISLFSEEVILILLPVEYHDSINIISIFSVLYASYFFSKHPQLIYAKKTWLSSLMFVLYIVLNIIINIPFAKNWGPLGVAWGSLLSAVLWGSIYFYVSQKSFYIHWESTKIITISLTFVLSVMVVILMRYFEVNYALRLGVKLISFIVFVYLGISYKIITKGVFLNAKYIFRNKIT
jgi:O-antigen/teichoic acid export membrane protein